MLAVFDNDGTICDSQEVEGNCFAQAIEKVTGLSLSTLDWSLYSEPTSSAIVRDLLAGDVDFERKEKEIEREFVHLLKKARPKFPGEFSPVPGAVEFIERLRRDKICSIAIGSGCFEASARFKLHCCGIMLEAFPYATSSDTPRRKDIIPLVASRAGCELASVVYIADGPWDYRVSAAFGIPMIGIGRRHEVLRDIGVPYTFRDYLEPDRIIEVLLHLMKNMPNEALQPLAQTVRSGKAFCWQKASHGIK
jgi:phosphoglycolate phosphatase-like HAD superfamily hydrolase